MIGYPFINLASVDSTNNYAMQLVKQGMATHGFACFAQEQTAGKGQRNKQWLSTKNENIILSVVLNTDKLFLSQQFYLNIISALAALDLFNNYTTNIFKIKWPNDLYWQDRKAAGILIENIIAGSIWKNAVVGLGLNINQTKFSDALKNPVSLKQITGKNYDAEKLAHELCFFLDKRFQQLMNENYTELLSEYNQNLYKKDEVVKFKKESKVFDGRILRVEESGQLIIKTAYEEAFDFGSLEWIIN